MSNLNRRKFLKLLGQGTAALGMGLSGRAWAQSRSTQAQKVSNNEWEIFYPGKYEEWEAKQLKKIQASIDQINNFGDLNVMDLVSDKLQGKPGVGNRETKVTLDNMMTFSNEFLFNRNALFYDREYAKKSKYGDLIAFPLILGLGAFPDQVREGFDNILGMSHTNIINFYKPLYEGDTLFTHIYEQNISDITPTGGRKHRSYTYSGSARTYNQKGQLVAEGAQLIYNSLRRHKDPAKRNKDGQPERELRGYWTRKPHIYTDKDWEYVTGLWKSEKVRGAEVRYWDDVNIGDELNPTASIPLMQDEISEALFNVPQWCTDIRKNMLDPKTFAKMLKNKQGIYVMPENLEKHPKSAPRIPSEQDERAGIQNTVLAKFAASMLFNWMGDEGWLQRMGWVIVPRPHYYDYEETPEVPKRVMPALFDKYPFLDNVPYMKGCNAIWHALENDLVIIRAYVFDKYEKDGEYFVDLGWWCQTLDKYLVQSGYAAVKLPKKI